MSPWSIFSSVYLPLPCDRGGTPIRAFQNQLLLLTLAFNFSSENQVFQLNFRLLKALSPGYFLCDNRRLTLPGSHNRNDFVAMSWPTRRQATGSIWSRVRGNHEAWAFTVEPKGFEKLFFRKVNIQLSPTAVLPTTEACSRCGVALVTIQ